MSELNLIEWKQRNSAAAADLNKKLKSYGLNFYPMLGDRGHCFFIPESKENWEICRSLRLNIEPGKTYAANHEIDPTPEVKKEIQKIEIETEKSMKDVRLSEILTEVRKIPQFENLSEGALGLIAQKRLMEESGENA